ELGFRYAFLTEVFLDQLPVLDQRVRLALEPFLQLLVRIELPHQKTVDHDQRRRGQQAASDAVVVPDDRVLQCVGQNEDDDQVERVELGEQPLADEFERANQEGVHDERSKHLLEQRNR